MFGVQTFQPLIVIFSRGILCINKFNIAHCLIPLDPWLKTLTFYFSYSNIQIWGIHSICVYLYPWWKAHMHIRTSNRKPETEREQESGCTRICNSSKTAIPQKIKRSMRCVIYKDPRLINNCFRPVCVRIYKKVKLFIEPIINLKTFGQSIPNDVILE